MNHPIPFNQLLKRQLSYVISTELVFSDVNEMQFRMIESYFNSNTVQQNLALSFRSYVHGCVVYYK